MGRVGGSGRGQERFPRVPKWTILHTFQECNESRIRPIVSPTLGIVRPFNFTYSVVVYHYLIMVLIFLDD